MSMFVIYGKSLCQGVLSPIATVNKCGKSAIFLMNLIKGKFCWLQWRCRRLCFVP